MYAAWLSGIMSNGEPAFASQCIQCEECLEKCPQHLEIPTLLECVVKELEEPDLKERLDMIKSMFRQT